MSDVAEVLEVPARSSGAVLAATKLHIPRVRPELVSRTPLIERLAGQPSHKITLIEAPPGYGKTTLLAEWCSSDSESRDFAWLTLDEGDSDPVRFWTGVIDAIRTLEPKVGRDAAGALETRSVDVRDVALPLLLNELAQLGREIVLVLDEYQSVRGDGVHHSVDFLLERLPERFHLALATRADPPLSLARLRAGAHLTEIRAADLRFSESEAAELLRRTVGMDVSDEEVARLYERTEGWPAGLYLAGLSLRGRDDPRAFIESFAGDDRHIVDYLSSEVLADQPPELREFLLRTSVLERLSGPLCDAVAEAEDSVRLLERIERRNLFLIPLDTTRTWYRYHRLFGELLRHELELSDSIQSRELHRRACKWYREEGSVPDAIHHASAAGDLDEARELIAMNWNDYFNRARLATVERWLDALPGSAVQEDPRLCVASAWMALDRGRLEDANEWIEVAERATESSSDEVAHGSIEAEVAVLRAVHGFKVAQLDRAREAALRVLDIAEPGSFPHTVAQLILGIVLYWSGELTESADVLREAAAHAGAAHNDLGRSYALGYLGLIEVDRGRAEAGDRLGWEAVTVSDARAFSEHFVLMVGHLARGRAAKHAGRLDAADEEIRRALELSDRGAGRLEVAGCRLAQARIRHLRGDADGARAALKEARAVIDECAQPGTLEAALAAGERGLRVAPRAGDSPALAGEELTERELAVLRLLASDLSRREIAEALYVSPNTVKTHAKSVYRKLDASTREEAVTRSKQLGLL